MNPPIVNDTSKPGPLGTFLFLGSSLMEKTGFITRISQVLYKKPSYLFLDGEKISGLFNKEKKPNKSALKDLAKIITRILIRQLKLDPYRVFVIKNIDAIDIDLSNLVFEVVKDGNFLDNQGNLIDCSKTIFIMTHEYAPQQATEEVRSEEEYLIMQDFIKKFPGYSLAAIDPIIFSTPSTEHAHQFIDKLLEGLSFKNVNGAITIRFEKDVSSFLLTEVFLKTRNLDKTFEFLLEKMEMHIELLRSKQGLSKGCFITISAEDLKLASNSR